MLFQPYLLKNVDFKKGLYYNIFNFKHGRKNTEKDEL